MLRLFPSSWTILAAAVLCSSASAQSWLAERENRLEAINPKANDLFGWSASISDDTAVVGARWGRHSGLTRPGEAFVFERDGAYWNKEFKLIASDAEDNAAFGWSSAISGDTIVVGAPTDFIPNTQPGAAYVYQRSGTLWIEQAKLTAPILTPGAHFGYTVDIDGDTIVVGAYENTPEGRAFVFARTGTTWSLEAGLVADDGRETDRFGIAVAVSGDTIVVGASYDDHSSGAVGSNLGEGSAYVFHRNGTTWTQQSKLEAMDPQPSDRFGGSVAVSGDTVLVGAWRDEHGVGLAGGPSGQGSAYAFVRSGTSWSEQAKLMSTPVDSSSEFGRFVDLVGNDAVVGAPSDRHPGTPGIGSFGQGSVFFYVRSGTSWSQEAWLTAPSPIINDQFGRAVALSPTTVLVGAPTMDTSAGSSAGAAEAFRLIGDPETGVTYCTAGTSASGCTALIASYGSPSAAASSGFLLLARGLDDGVGGMFFYGANGRQANPWGNGSSYQCVVPPVRRAGIATGGRGVCGGIFAQDLNARWCPTCSHASHNPGVGAVVQAQLWYRDPLNTSIQTTSLSDAIEFVVGP